MSIPEDEVTTYKEFPTKRCLEAASYELRRVERLPMQDGIVL